MVRTQFGLAHLSAIVGLGVLAVAGPVRAETQKCVTVTLPADTEDSVITLPGGASKTVKAGKAFSYTSCEDGTAPKSTEAPRPAARIAESTPQTQMRPQLVAAVYSDDAPPNTGKTGKPGATAEPDAGTPGGSTVKKGGDEKPKPADFYAGVGLALSQNLGSRRADQIKFLTRSDGQVLAQVQTVQDANINILVESHILLKKQGIFNPGSTPIDAIGKIAACGPFSFVNDDGDNGENRECGPMVVGLIDSSGKATQFGLGWALGLGAQSNGRYPFGIGIGLMVDTSDQVVDGNVIDKKTMLVKPQYQSLISSSTNFGLVKRPTTSLFFMLSKTF